MRILNIFEPKPEIDEVVRIKLSEKKYITGILAATTACTLFSVGILKPGSLSITDAPLLSGIILVVDLLVYLLLKVYFKHIANRVYIEINQTGIAYKGGLIPWGELECFCIRITVDDEGGNREALVLTSTDKRLSKTIDYEDLNTDLMHLRSCIIALNTNTNLVDNGVQHVKA